ARRADRGDRAGRRARHAPGRRPGDRSDGGAHRSRARTATGPDRRGGPHRAAPDARRGVPPADDSCGGGGVTVLPAPASRLVWALTDAGTLTRRYLAHLRRQPEQLVLTLGFPILILLVFVYLMGGMLRVPGGDYRQLLLPG